MATLIAEFTVVGTPVPQGSARAFAGKGKAAGRAFLTNDPTGSISKWRGDIKGAFERGLPEPDDFEPVDHAVSMRLAFRIARQKSHFLPITRSRLAPELRLDAPEWVVGGADLDKLVRAVLDALTGVVYVDDCQVVVIGATKQFGDRPGVDVRVSAL